MNFFPTLYPDELLYSACARYAARSGNINSIYNIEDLFGTRNAIACVELPTKLDSFIDNMPIGIPYSVEDVIWNHTLLPYYAAFNTEERVTQVIQSMQSGKGSIPYTKLGISSGFITLNRYLRFCPECYREDKSKYGEPYWHRIHQVTGLFVCPRHNIPLYDSTVLIRGGNRQNFVTASKDNCIADYEIKYNSNLLQKMIFMAQDTQDLFSLKHRFYNPTWYRNKFRNVMMQFDYARQNNYICQKKLIHDFNEYYGEEFLELMQSPIGNTDHNWLTTILRKNNSTTFTCRYLLIAKFLDIPLEFLFNEVCNGLTDYQQLWDSRLRELIGQNLSIREIAIILEASTKTIRKRIDQLGIKKFWKDNGGGKYRYNKYINTEEYKEKRKEYRKHWTSLMHNNPDKSSNELRKVSPVIYRWLTKYDIEWLRSHAGKKKNRVIIDWNLRDTELLPKVKYVVLEMKRGKLERISWGSIGGKLGISGWLSKYKDKLPITKEYILSVIETLQQYQIRKITWAIDELNKDGINITKWNLLEKAGVKQKYIPNISTELSRILNDRGCGFLLDHL